MILQELSVRELNPTTSRFNSKDEILDRLVEPTTADFIDFSRIIREYWIVFDEYPDNALSGYLIVYDEREELFGLATKTSTDNNEVGYLIGLYGSFVDTLDNM